MTEIKAEMTASVWKVNVVAGQQVEADEELLILESMKMEMPVETDDDGTVSKICVKEGQAVKEGEVLVVIDD